MSTELGTQDSWHQVPSCLPLKEIFLWFNSLAFSLDVDAIPPCFQSIWIIRKLVEDNSRRNSETGQDTKTEWGA